MMLPHLPASLAFLLLSRLVDGRSSTRTERRCRTFYGPISPWEVATHITTTLTNQVPITVGFTTKPTSTLSLAPAPTYNETVTQISIETETATQSVKGPVFFSTSTVYVMEYKHANLTTTYDSVWISSAQYTINLNIPTIEGWIPVNTTTGSYETRTVTMAGGRVETNVIEILPSTTTSTDAAAPTLTAIPLQGDRAQSNLAPVTTVPGSLPAEQMIYVLADGHLVPTPLAAVSDLILDSTVPAITSLPDRMGRPASPAGGITTIPDSIVSDTAGDSRVGDAAVTFIPEVGAKDPVADPRFPGAAGSGQGGHRGPLSALLSDLDRAEAQYAAAQLSAVQANDVRVSSKGGTTSDQANVSALASPPSNMEQFDDATMTDQVGTSTSSSRITAITISADAKPTRTMETISKTFTPPNNNQHHRRALTRVPKNYFGLRGALYQDPTSRPPFWPTQVSCTKSLVVETTVYSPISLGPFFVAPTPVTLTTTSLRVLTSTLTVPYPTPSRTSTFVTTTTLRTTSYHHHHTTSVSTQIHTVTSTRTALAACQSQNLYGPRGHKDAHIVNLYVLDGHNDNSPKRYVKPDVGQAGDAESCCVECHDSMEACLGSVWDVAKNRCYLVMKRAGGGQDQCRGQGEGAGVFVQRPSGERSGRGKHRWPQWRLSNGPCGYWVDGGTGW